MEAEISILTLYKEVEWLQRVIEQVIRSYLMQEGHEEKWQDIPLPDLTEVTCPYSDSVKAWNLDIYGRLALALAMAPHLKPEIMDVFFGKNQIYDRGFTEFGGVLDKNHSGFLPTGQTLCFLLTATNLELRGIVESMLSKENILIKESILLLGEIETHLPKLNGTLSIHQSWFNFFVTGTHYQIENTPDFPAQKISTIMKWDDIVLDDLVRENVSEIENWLKHGNTLMQEWGLNKHLKPGYKALFYGPPGTGKTLTATLLGKSCKRDVYKIDLSMTVSKYIGETEKNLSKIFDMAQDKNWILFFDEADALFGKRTSANTSNDRYANQQTAYLLQRIEDFPGVVILATNLSANMDEAFMRRFQSVIHFTMPGARERYELWKNVFSGTCRLNDSINLEKIAEEHELAGGAIINVLRFCALATIKRNDSRVTEQELLAGIKRELKKENKTLKVSYS